MEKGGKGFNKKYILFGVIAIVVIGVAVFLIMRNPFSNLSQQNSIDYSQVYPSSSSDVSGFEMKKTGSAFIVYYHTDNDANANKLLAILEQSGLVLYEKYLGIQPTGIPVHLTTDIDEYVRVADFPGGKENVRVGDGSAPNGKIYVYKPFEENTPGKTEGMIIHEGVHAVIYQFLGSTSMHYLPGFLNEGFAHYIEFVFKAGENFNPLEQIYHSDLLVDGIKTGNPRLLSLDELSEQCEGYIPNEETNFLCRAQGTFTVWYLNKEYRAEALNQFFAKLKQTQDWKKSLEDATNKSISQLGMDINGELKELVE